MRSCLSVAAVLSLLTAGCNGSDSGPEQSADANRPGPAANASAEAPVEPAAPGTPGGLPDDRTPVSEAPFSETSAQGAAQVVQSYFALLEARDFAAAYRLWSDHGRASGLSEARFAADSRNYREVHAQIGAPGPIEGAAGSLYVEVPIQVYGRRADGRAFRRAGTVTLRRVNDVPGSTAEQRRWHIARIAAEPRT